VRFGVIQHRAEQVERLPLIVDEVLVEGAQCYVNGEATGESQVRM